MKKYLHWLAKHALHIGVAAAAAVALTVSIANAAGESDNGAQVTCAPDADLIVHPGGTWSCGATPAPTATTSPSTSPSPSTAPPTSTSPTPSKTTSTTSSPSPTPSTSTTPPSGLKNCWADPAACGYPSPASTGYPKMTVLTPYAGSLSISSGTVVIDGKSLGCVYIYGTANVTIRNSLITCPGGPYGIEAYGGATVNVINTEVTCVTGIGTAIDRSSNATVNVVGANLHDCENGFWMESNTSIVDSYIRVVTIGGAHSDGIQVISSSNMVIRHNTIRPDNFVDPGSTSSIIMAGQTMHNLVIENNLMSSGQYTLYCPSGGEAIITGNRFAGPIAATLSSTLGTVYGPHYGYGDNCNHAGITWTNNVRDDTGALITASQ